MSVDFLSVLSDQRAELERLDLSQLVARKEEQLIMMYGEKREIVENGKTVRCMLAADWLRSLSL